jgi:hypothetical protein
MLPQKFSAATTVSTVEPDEPGDAEVPVAVLVPFPQPARSRVSPSPSPRAVHPVDRLLALIR